MSAPIGVLGAPALVAVDGRGRIDVPAAGATIDWLLSVGDGWKRPSTDPTVRQTRLGAAPVAVTRVSVPGGDVVQRVFGAAGRPPVAVVDVANESPEPVALALVVAGARGVSSDGTAARIGGATVLVATRAAMQGVVATDEAAVVERVLAHATTAGGVLADARAGAAALVWPLPHRTALRFAVPLGDGATPVAPADLAARPDADAVARGWDAALERGMRIDHDDRELAELVDAARAGLLVNAGVDRPRPDASVFVACEDWGFDAEAEAVWNRLSLRDRRRARRRGGASTYAALRGEVVRAAGSLPPDPATLLRVTRAALVDDRDERVDALPGFPFEWLGRNLAVHDAPIRRGLASCARRWHGSRPALLWDLPVGVTMHAPALDPSFVATGAGETLLAEPHVELLPMGTPPDRPGEVVEPPDTSFT